MKNVIKRGQVELEPPSPAPLGDPGAAARAARANASARAHAARVRLVEIDGATQVIELTCACGEVSLIEVQCAKPS